MVAAIRVSFPTLPHLLNHTEYRDELHLPSESSKRLTHVSFTPHKLGHVVASSKIKSESRSIPALAPGSVCVRVYLDQQMDSFGRETRHAQLYTITGTGLFSATSV